MSRSRSATLCGLLIIALAATACSSPATSSSSAVNPPGRLPGLQHSHRLRGRHLFDLPQAPVELHTPATRTETAALAKYEHFTGVPSFNWSYGWLSADLFIRGLEAAGKNPTRASFIARIRTISWDGGGLLPQPADLSRAGFGKSPATACAYFAQLKGSTFVPMNGRQAVLRSHCRLLAL